VVQESGYTEAPGEKDGQRDLVELGRGPVRRAVDKPVLKPTTVRTLPRLQVAERSQGRGSVAGVEEGGGDAAQIAGPDEVVDVVAVVIGLTPWRARSSDEGAGV